PGRPDRRCRAGGPPRAARPRDAGALPGPGGRRPSRVGEPQGSGQRGGLAAAVPPSARRPVLRLALAVDGRDADHVGCPCPHDPPSWLVRAGTRGPDWGRGSRAATTLTEHAEPRP